MNEKILVVDDEQAIVDLIQMELSFEGYQVETAYDGEEAIAKARAFQPNLILLDIMLPKMNGYDVCKILTQEMDMPIILLTAKTDIIDKVLGLELGADDYITKPFDNRELLARVKAHLRRAGKTNAATKENTAAITNGPLVIRLEERTVTIDGKEIHLTPKEFDLLYLLADNPERVFSRDVLYEKIWGYDYDPDAVNEDFHSKRIVTRTVDMHVQRIRRKIDKEPQKYIQTVFGIGYKMRKC